MSAFALQKFGGCLNVHQQMNGQRRCGMCIYIYNIYIYIMEYYSPMKKNETMSFAANGWT